MSRPTPRHTLAHLSDLHLTGDGSGVGGVVEPRDQIRFDLLQARSLGPDLGRRSRAELFTPWHR